MFQRQILLFSFFLILLTSTLAFQEARKATNENHVTEFVNRQPPSKRSTKCICGYATFKCCIAKRTLPKVGFLDNFYMIFTVYTYNGIIIRVLLKRHATIAPE